MNAFSLVFLASISLHHARASEKVIPAVSVSGRAGAFELTLRVLKTSLKVEEAPWVQIQLRNISKSTVSVPDTAFRDPMQLRENWWHRFQTYIEVLTPDGKIKWDPFEAPAPVADNGFELRASDDFGDTPEAKELRKKLGPLREQWKKEGLSREDAVLKERLFISDFWKEKRPDPPPTLLGPGQSITTRPWAHQNWTDELRKKPLPKPIGAFMQLRGFIRPGTYRMRAVYDFELSKSTLDLYKSRGIAVRPDNVKVQTDWVQLKVSK